MRGGSVVCDGRRGSYNGTPCRHGLRAVCCARADCSGVLVNDSPRAMVFRAMVPPVQWSSTVQCSGTVRPREMAPPCNGHADLYLRPPFSHTHHITSLPLEASHSQLLFIGSLY